MMGAVADLITLQEAVNEFHVGVATLYRYLQKAQLRRYKPGGRTSQGTRTFVDRAELRRLLQPQPVAPAKLGPRRRTGYIRTAVWHAQRERGLIKLKRRKDETDTDWAARRHAELAAAQDRARRRRPERPRPTGTVR
jgi:hypothetical protein